MPDPKVDPNPKPDKAVKFKKYETDLKVLNKENLYDFLAGDSTTDIIGLQTLSGKELIASYSNPLKERVKHEKLRKLHLHVHCVQLVRKYLIQKRLN